MAPDLETLGPLVAPSLRSGRYSPGPSGFSKSSNNLGRRVGARATAGACIACSDAHAHITHRFAVRLFYSCCPGEYDSAEGARNYTMTGAGKCIHSACGCPQVRPRAKRLNSTQRRPLPSPQQVLNHYNWEGRFLYSGLCMYEALVFQYVALHVSFPPSLPVSARLSSHKNGQ